MSEDPVVYDNQPVSRSLVRVIAESSDSRHTLSFPLWYIQATGSIQHAAVLQEIVFWSAWAEAQGRPGGWFYRKNEEWQERLGLSPYQMRSIISDLKDLNIGIETKSMKPAGIDTPVVHFRVHDAGFRTFNFSTECEKTSQTECEKTSQTECEKTSPSRECEKTSPSTYTESTTESTKAVLVSGTNKPASEEPDAPKPRKRLTAIEKARALYTDPQFEAFWKAYPKKTDKLEAAQAWLKVSPSAETFAEIMAALNAAKVSDKWTKNNGEYVDAAKNWIGKDRWQNTIPGTAASSTANMGKQTLAWYRKLEAEVARWGPSVQQPDPERAQVIRDSGKDPDDFDWSVYSDGRKGNCYAFRVRFGSSAKGR